MGQENSQRRGRRPGEFRGIWEEQAGVWAAGNLPHFLNVDHTCTYLHTTLPHNSFTATTATDHVLLGPSSPHIRPPPYNMYLTCLASNLSF